MWLFIIKFLVGLLLVVKGADFLTDGASSIARKFKVSTLLIGLTIVSLGTSLPELVVSSVSAMKGSSDMALGNVVGSNMFNTLAIVGVTALFCPIVCKKDLLLRDIPVNVLVTCTLFVMVYFCNGIGILTRMEGITLLTIFVIYMGFTIYTSLKSSKRTDEAPVEAPMPIWKAIVLIVLGLTALVFGGDWFVDGAAGIAAELGVSESVIALTIVSAGTSFPELATSVVAARKGDTDMAMGNVVGSNIFNIMFILGVASVINPIAAKNISIVDFKILLFSILLLTVFCVVGKRHRIGRWQGAVLTICMIAYYAYLIYNS
ncbi:MAG: calcium/sodium antiporter [Bacteroidaceae bacterium]|nr:calcium/sodium antiporter [Bacteroidaceae bacterium]